MNDDAIIIEMLDSDTVYDWLNEKLVEFDGHDLNAIGTIGTMLEDLTEFVNKNEFIYKHFIEFIKEKHDEAEETFH